MRRLAMVLLALGACTPSPSIPPTLTLSTDTVDFGVGAPGIVQTAAVTLRNEGTSPLTIESIVRTGAAVSIPAWFSFDEPAFTLELEKPLVLAAGEERTVDISWRPLSGTKHEAVLLFFTKDPARQVRLTLRGLGAVIDCDLLPGVDFGAVNVGQTAVRELTFFNARPIEATFSLGTVRHLSGEAAFTLEPDAPQGDFVVPPQSSRVVHLSFAPTMLGAARSLLTARTSSVCPPTTLQLRGDGVSGTLSKLLPVPDFGPSLLFEEEVVTMTLLNQGFSPATISALSLTDSHFRVVSTGTADLTRVVVPAALRDQDGSISPGSAELKVGFRPVDLTPRTASLVGQSDVQGEPPLTHSFSGQGATPRLEVQPSPRLDFGTVTQPSTLTLTLSSVGIASTRPELQLRLGNPDGGAAFELSSSELCVGSFDAGVCVGELDTYDHVQGIAPGNSLSVPVRFAPVGAGPRAVELKIHSTDLLQPVQVVTIVADVP